MVPIKRLLIYLVRQAKARETRTVKALFAFLFFAVGCTGSSEEIELEDQVARDFLEAGNELPLAARGNLTIDLDAGTIAGVSWQTSVEEIRSRFGTDNVRQEIRSLEGMPDTLYVVSIAGHELTRHWNAVSTRDTAFVTTEGLGVGSTIAELEEAYGPTETGQSELGEYLRFGAFSILIPDECGSWTPNGDSTIHIDRDCRPVAIFV